MTLNCKILDTPGFQSSNTLEQSKGTATEYQGFCTRYFIFMIRHSTALFSRVLYFLPGRSTRKSWCCYLGGNQGHEVFFALVMLKRELCLDKQRETMYNWSPLAYFWTYLHHDEGEAAPLTSRPLFHLDMGESIFHMLKSTWVRNLNGLVLNFQKKMIVHNVP